jgi:hypothetical protein
MDKVDATFQNNSNKPSQFPLKMPLTVWEKGRTRYNHNFAYLQYHLLLNPISPSPPDSPGSH